MGSQKQNLTIQVDVRERRRNAFLPPRQRDEQTVLVHFKSNRNHILGNESQVGDRRLTLVDVGELKVHLLPLIGDAQIVVRSHSSHHQRQ